MRKNLRNLEWFLLWSVAFYATALAFAFDSRGALGAALTSLAVALTTLGCCFAAAVRPGSRR